MSIPKAPPREAVERIIDALEHPDEAKHAAAMLTLEKRMIRGNARGGTLLYLTLAAFILAFVFRYMPSVDGIPLYAMGLAIGFALGWQMALRAEISSPAKTISPKTQLALVIGIISISVLIALIAPLLVTIPLPLLNMGRGLIFGLLLGQFVRGIWKNWRTIRQLD